MKVQSECPRCKKKNVQEIRESKLGNTRFITLDCGHTYTDSITLEDKRELYPFQVEGVHFLERNNFRGLITDEMGLGKTIQAVGGVHLHYDELKPILCIVKASLTYQWLREIVGGTGRIAQILDAKTPPIPGLGIYICSYDAIPPRKIKGDKAGRKKGGLLDTINKLKIKTLILDECQMMKNHDSSRTEAIRDIVRATKPLVLNKNPLQRDRIEKITRDLMLYHGINKRFELYFSDLAYPVLGLTEIRSFTDGLANGRITIDRGFAEKNPEDEIVEVILHEIAHALSPGAGHNSAWSDCAKSIGGKGTQFVWCSGSKDVSLNEVSVKHIIALSGTPIKNNAIEYFPILNLLRPELFPNRDRFITYEVDFYHMGGTSYKAGGLKYPEEFKERTKDFIIRRTRNEVMPDLPKIRRDYKYYPLMEEVQAAYNKNVKVLSDVLDREEEGGHSKFELGGDLLSALNKLRHITGFAKLEPVIDYVNEFMEESENEEKITIFHHHIDVGDILELKLSELFPNSVLRMKSTNSSEERMNLVDSFREDKEKRIFIVPTLAGGEGINLQFCSHSIIMEREWNPANEEQAEGRFSRIGSTASSVLVNYPTATGTIDEFFAELVERKREAVGITLDGAAAKWDESNIMRELATLVVKKWRAQ